MVDDDALLETFERFATGLVNPYDVSDVLHELVERVVVVVGSDGAGVSLARGDAELGFVAASDVEVAQVEEHQEVRGGPCHDAFDGDRPVVVDDLRDEERWPEYRRAAEELGFRAVIAVPIPTNTSPIGALNVYCHEARAWSQREVEVAEMVAAMAAGYLLTSVALSSPTALSNQLADALSRRTVVEQALGKIGGHLDLDRSDAFGVLHDHARRADTTLHDVARQVIDDEVDVTDEPSLASTTGSA